MLRNVINVELTDRMMIVQELDTLEKYCDLLIRIANRMKKAERQNKKKNWNWNRDQTSALAFAFASTSFVLTFASFALDDESMNWSAFVAVAREKQRARMMNSTDIQQRKNNNLCIRCDDSSHYIDKCSYLSLSRSNSNTRVTSIYVVLMLKNDVIEDDKKEKESKNV